MLRRTAEGEDANACTETEQANGMLAVVGLEHGLAVLYIVMAGMQQVKRNTMQE